MPPLSLTQSKYALATLPIVVKSTPGISMAIPPSLIGAPVAFLPLPRPHLPAAAEPVPTFVAVEPLAATIAIVTAATISATGTAANRALRCIDPSSFLWVQQTLKLSLKGISQGCGRDATADDPTRSAARMQDAVPDAGIHIPVRA